MVNYELFKKDIKTDSHDVTTYGIIIMENNKVIRRVPDITADSAAIFSFIATINEHSLALCHFDDAVENFLLEN